MMTHLMNSSIVASRRLKRRLTALIAETKASVAVEMAFMLPIFASMAFLTFDAGTIYTQYNRATTNLYSIGDIVSSQSDDLTCDRLDRISEMVYDSFAHANWARRVRENEDFRVDGALDFRFRVNMVRAETQPDGSVRGRVEWSYSRAQLDAIEPNTVVSIPSALHIPDQRFVQIEGFFHLAPALNYMGVFDMSPDTADISGLFETERYFPLRFVPSVDLVASPDDPYSNKCRG